MGSVCVFVSDASGDNMVDTYLSMGLVMALYIARIVSFCFPHVVDIHGFVMVLMASTNWSVCVLCLC